MASTLPLFLALGCTAPEYGLTPESSRALGLQPDPPAVVATPGEALPPSESVRPPEPLVQVQPDGSATTSWKQGDLRRDEFDLSTDATTPLVDYLFIVDGSSSMRQVLDRVQAGLTGLTQAGSFPARSRLAVMSTTPADDLSPRRAHPAVKQRGLARQAPGFVSLVSDASIRRYRERGGDRAIERYPLDGCGPWFSPGDLNPQGQPCLLAHTQVPLLPVRVEDGLTAFRQLVDHTAGNSIFRTGAAVNLVVISDTHAPGFRPRADQPQLSAWFDELAAERPDHDELVQLLAADHDLSALRLHAIAPQQDCGERNGDLGTAYFDVAAQSGGVIADICTVQDYRPVIQQIVQTGARLQRPVLALSSRADAVSAVTVDGRPVGFTLSRDGKAVVLDAMPDTQARVEVRYDRPQPAFPKGAARSR